MNFLIYILSVVLLIISTVYSAPQFYGPPRYGYGGYGGYGGYHGGYRPHWGHHFPPPPPPFMGHPPVVQTTVVRTITTTVG